MPSKLKETPQTSMQQPVVFNDQQSKNREGFLIKKGESGASSKLQMDGDIATQLAILKTSNNLMEKVNAIRQLIGIFKDAVPPGTRIITREDAEETVSVILDYFINHDSIPVPGKFEGFEALRQVFSVNRQYSPEIIDRTVNSVISISENTSSDAWMSVSYALETASKLVANNPISEENLHGLVSASQDILEGHPSLLVRETALKFLQAITDSVDLSQADYSQILNIALSSLSYFAHHGGDFDVFNIVGCMFVSKNREKVTTPDLIRASEIIFEIASDQTMFYEDRHSALSLLGNLCYQHRNKLSSADFEQIASGLNSMLEIQEYYMRITQPYVASVLAQILCMTDFPDPILERSLGNMTSLMSVTDGNQYRGSIFSVISAYGTRAISIVLPKLENLLGQGTIDMDKAAVLLLKCGFLSPELFDSPSYSLFKLDRETAIAMRDQSPEWSNYPGSAPESPDILVEIEDYKRIYELAKNYPQENVAKILFNSSNITHFSGMPVIEQQYRQYQVLTGQKTPKDQLIVVVQTKRMRGVTAWRSLNHQLWQENEGRLDMMCVEPGNDQKLVENIGKIYEKTGKKISLVVWNLHGGSTTMALKQTDDSDLFFVDLSDADLLRRLKDYFEPGKTVNVLNSCSTAGGLPLDSNLAEFIGKNTSSLSLGFTEPSTSIESLPLKIGAGGLYEPDLEKLKAGGYPNMSLNSYDYRNIGSIGSAGLTAQELRDGTVELRWNVSPEPNVLKYDIERIERGGMGGEFVQKLGEVDPSTNSFTYRDLGSGTFYYRIREVKKDDFINDYGLPVAMFSFAYSDEVALEQKGLAAFQSMNLSNFPNPFNQSTTISFMLPVTERATVKIYDILGQEVATLVQNQEMPVGENKIAFDASGLASGTYICKIDAGGKSETIKMLLVK